jgi:uncharacterized protein YigE (DUF2233 family)
MLFLFLLTSYISLTPISIQSSQKNISNFLSYEVDLSTQQLDFYWKDKNEKNYGSLQNLKNSLQQEEKELVFAMNGGMYLKDQSPQGLYIEDGIIKSPIDTKKGARTNFYLHPNGVFILTNHFQAIITTTANFTLSPDIKYATQSGPMLLIDGAIHPKFTEGSANVHIRNGVGILPNGNLLFAMSKETTNVYDFACFFKDKGCKNALYLDGFVSRTYLPSQQWEQLDGNFGVIIAETKRKK